MGKAKWTPEQKQEALRIYEKLGPAEASRQTGIPKGTIKSWASRDELQPVATVAADNMKAANEVLSLTRDQKRIKLQDEVLDKARIVIGRIDRTLATAKDCKDLAMAGERLLNMFRLEMGEATSRTENTGVGERAETYLQGYRDAFKKDSEQRT